MNLHRAARLLGVLLNGFTAMEFIAGYAELRLLRVLPCNG